MYQRSTKGASKQRRDLINVEINEVKDLLPVSDSIRKRLSQLQIMALCNSYIAKSNCFQNSIANADLDQCVEFSDCFDFSEALPGFLLAITLDGKLLYISENVTEYLGHSVVELMTQADTVYDVIDRREHHVLREFLQSSKVVKCDNVKDSSLDELDFICHMNLGQLFRRNNVFDRQKVMKVHGRVIWPEGALTLTEPIFVGRVTPVLGCLPSEQLRPVPDTMMFYSTHSLDLRFLSIEHNGEFHLGYEREELMDRSWYHIVHPDYISETTSKHVDLMQKGLDTAKSLVVRVQTKYGQFVWLHIVMRFASTPFSSLGADNLPQEIICLNHVIDEKQALDTMKHSKMEERLLSSGYHCAFDSTFLPPREAYVPTVVVEEELLDHMMNEGKPSVNCNHDELMQRIRQKAQGKQSKKMKLSDPTVSDYAKYDVTNYTYHQNTLTQYMMNIPGTQMREMKCMSGIKKDDMLGGPLTPASSEDSSADYGSINYTVPTPEFIMSTPPYSPSGSSFVDETAIMTSQQDEVSFFDGLIPGSKPSASLAVKRKREESFCDELPELDQCLVEHILRGFEGSNSSSLNFYQNSLPHQLPSNMSMINSSIFGAATFQPMQANHKYIRSDCLKAHSQQVNVYESSARSLADYGPIYRAGGDDLDLISKSELFESNESPFLGGPTFHSL